jgi:hypothetical protein
VARVSSASIVAIQSAASEAVKVISSAAMDATTKLANAAEVATRVVSAAAAEQTKMVDNKNSGDHDLLVVLNTKMEDLKAAVREFADRHNDYVLKEDFVFWRNLLISSMLATVVIGVIANMLTRAK